MDFAQIDEVVDKFCKTEKDGNDISEKLDQYDIEKLKIIYSKLTNKNGQLLRRVHLCEEIIKIYEQNKEKLDEPDIALESEIRVICSWMLANKSSYRNIVIKPNQTPDWKLFNCNNREDFYQQCYEALIYRSENFSKIATTHRSLSKHACFSELIDLYFDTFYTGYNEFMRDWLLIMTIGINLFKYHIVKLQAPYEFNGEKQISPWVSNSELSIYVTYDSETQRLGIFHTKLPKLSRIEDTSSIQTIHSECKEKEKEIDDNMPTSKENIRDNLSYSSSFFRGNGMQLDYSIENEKKSEISRIRDIFLNL